MNRSDLDTILLVIILIIVALMLFGVGVTTGKAF